MRSLVIPEPEPTPPETGTLEKSLLIRAVLLRELWAVVEARGLVTEELLTLKTLDRVLMRKVVGQG